jgi:DNA-binding CsgD family transcriptional regulator
VSEQAGAQGDTDQSASLRLLHWLLDEIDLGIGIIGTDGLVAYLNRSMRAMTAQQDGLALSHNRLCASELHPILNGRQKSPSADGQAFRISRPSGAKAFLCLLKPIATAPREPRLFALFVVDASRAKAASPRRIVELFGVTNQEARIASLLAAGARLDEASAQMGISIGTGRFHLKNLLGKTATSRQAELSQLINCLFDKID